MAFVKKRYKRRNPFISPRARTMPEKLHTAATMSGGQITNVDAADIPNEALSLAKNVRVRFDKTIRREGFPVFTPAKPDSFRVQRLFEFKQGISTKYFIRVTPNSIYYSNGSTWTQLTGDRKSVV